MHTVFSIAIPRRSSCCLQCQKMIQSGMEYYSLLKKQGDNDQYERFDYCLACWQTEINADGIYWKAIVPIKKSPSELPKQKDARALQLLKENLACNNPEEAAETFVLSLYLARRRRLLFRKELPLADGQRGTLYEVPETEEMIVVPKVLLSELQVEKLQLILAKKFQKTDNNDN